MHDSPAVLLLMALTCGATFWAFENPAIEEKFLFRPERILTGKEYYRLLSSALIHSGWAHLLLNMYTLYAFAPGVAWMLGQGHFLLIYLGSVVGGNLLSLYLHRNHEYAAYGASVGVCGIIFAYVLEFPHRHLALFPLPYAVPAWLYAIAFMIASFYAMKAQKENIGHDAHLGGAIIGLLLTAALEPELVRRAWFVFSLLLGLSAFVLAYVWMNPLLLPLSIADLLRAFAPSRQRSQPSAARPKPPLRRVAPRRSGSSQSTPVGPADWLIAEIEGQVGELRPDLSGRHSWIDKFGRSYDVLVGAPASFTMDWFKAELTRLLSDPAVHFVIVDTRRLRDEQVALIRPILADLPDSEFHRVLRSYAFKTKGAN